MHKECLRFLFVIIPGMQNYVGARNDTKEFLRLCTKEITFGELARTRARFLAGATDDTI